MSYRASGTIVQFKEASAVTEVPKRQTPPSPGKRLKEIEKDSVKTEQSSSQAGKRGTNSAIETIKQGQRKRRAEEFEELDQRLVELELQLAAEDPGKGRRRRRSKKRKSKSRWSKGRRKKSQPGIERTKSSKSAGVVVHLGAVQESNPRHEQFDPDRSEQSILQDDRSISSESSEGRSSRKKLRARVKKVFRKRSRSNSMTVLDANNANNDGEANGAHHVTSIGGVVGLVKAAFHDVWVDLMVQTETQPADASEHIRTLNHHKYRMEKRFIARGGFSEVYPASRRGKIYAIKVCDLDVENIRKREEKEMALQEKLIGFRYFTRREVPVQQAASLDQLDKEVGILKMLAEKEGGDNYITVLHEAFLYNKTDQVFLVMDRFTTNLDALAREDKFKRRPDARIFIIHAIVKAMVFLSEARVIHADLKPQNVLLNLKGEVRLGDFGLATELEENQNSIEVTQIVGSTEYLAPEMLELGWRYDLTADVWSLGILVFAMYDRGKSMFDQFQDWRRRLFNEDYWNWFETGEIEYCNNFLGTRYLTEDERKEKSQNPAKDTVIQRMFARAARQVKDIAPIVRGCLVPHPEQAKHRGISREMRERMPLTSTGFQTGVLEQVEELVKATNKSEDLRRTDIIEVVRSLVRS